MKVLLVGVDTLHVGFRPGQAPKVVQLGRSTVECMRELRNVIENAQRAPKGERIVRLRDGSEWGVGGGTKWHVGSIERDGLRLMVVRDGLPNNPEVTAECGSQLVHRMGWRGAWEHARKVTTDLLDRDVGESVLSRVDPCVDVQGAPFERSDVEDWVAKLRRSTERGPDSLDDSWERWYAASHVNSLRWGSRVTGACVRIYDKAREIREQSSKTWFYKLWAKNNAGAWPEGSVWRVELELHRKAIRGGVKREGEGAALSIDTPDGLARAIPFLWREYLTSRLRWTTPKGANRARWPLRPEWKAIAGVDWPDCDAGAGEWVKVEQAQAEYVKRLASLRGVLLGAAVRRRGARTLEEALSVCGGDIAHIDREQGRDFEAERREERIRLGLDDDPPAAVGVAV